MQSDEDIGKVAQATPIVVAKALELFMTSLIQESCNQARSRNAKRITPAHLKQAVKSTEHFDFLVEMVEKYPDPVAPRSPTPSATTSATSSNNEPAEVKEASEEPVSSNDDNTLDQDETLTSAATDEPIEDNVNSNNKRPRRKSRNERTNYNEDNDEEYEEEEEEVSEPKVVKRRSRRNQA